MKNTIQLGQHPAITLMYTTASAIAGVASALRRTAERQANRFLAERTVQALGWVDDRTLRDIGLTRSEISSIAGEIAGDVEVSRERVARMHR
ncbi:MAG: DUF1127 domain-containing protein [Hydrogenophaga sp.]|nr:DUF1127 domain-containing protein [Hydrogenophaga sp.]